MSYLHLNFKNEYRSPKDDVVQEVFIPALLQSKIYKRSVGFFSSTSLVEITKGVAGLVENGGKILIVASPKLSESDEVAIKIGYEKRPEYIEKKLLGDLDFEIKDYFDKERLNLLANLIATDTLNLKIAFTNTDNELGMYHEKLGVFEDSDGNSICFDGSMNESKTAMRYNYESVNIYCSWKKEDSERVKGKIKAFEDIWNNTDKHLTVIEFPAVTKKILEKFKISDLSGFDLVEKAKQLDNLEKEKNRANDEGVLEIHEPDIIYKGEKDSKGPYIPDYIHLYDYQKEAIRSWERQKYVGIFDMATGTGKTLTGLGALATLSENIHGQFCAIILCPYIHLVTQWVEDIEKFNIKPIIAFGSSPQKNWKDKLDRAVTKRNSKQGGEGFFCLVTTVRTFCSDYVQGKLKRIKTPICLIADEAHNVGSKGAKKHLEEEKYQYRLALSATIDRHHDELGTNFLYEFFGEKCIVYDLKRAIAEGRLVQYKYYPILVSLDDEEREEYIKLTKEIGKEILQDSKSGKLELTERGKLLCIIRSRIIARCNAKIPALRSKMKPYKDSNNILVYCGATTYQEDCFDDSSDEEGIKQIDLVIKDLYATYGMKISKFVAEKTPEERKVIIEEFAKGENIQVIAAIKCLDEGVNIPSIQTAFILASSTNSKEYIQRRGRVLRRYPGKECAEIFDFVCLPYSVDTAMNQTSEESDVFRTLVKNEINRMREFSSLSMNTYVSEPLIKELETAFCIKDKNEPIDDLMEALYE